MLFRSLREDSALVSAFLTSYAAQRALRPGFEQRFRLYMALDRMIIWEYGQRNRIWFQEGTTLRDWAEPFTSFPIGDFLQ